MTTPGLDYETCVVLHSGGLDSTALLHYIRIEKKMRPVAFAVCYGQRHVTELDHARRLCEDGGIESYQLDLPDLRYILQGSSQTDDSIEVPEGHYEAESMKITVVPNRNMTLISLAAGFAISRGYGNIAIAAHAGDHAIYPDCRAPFLRLMDAALSTCHFQPVNLYFPFYNTSKTSIVRWAAEHAVDLSGTWSCYKGGYKHCGKCGTCVERKEAFQMAGVPDPTIYLA